MVLIGFLIDWEKLKCEKRKKKKKKMICWDMKENFLLKTSRIHGNQKL